MNGPATAVASSTSSSFSMNGSTISSSSAAFEVKWCSTALRVIPRSSAMSARVVAS